MGVRRAAYVATVAALCVLALPATGTAKTSVRFCRVAPPAIPIEYSWNGNVYASTTTSCATAHAIFWAVVSAYVRVALVHDDAPPPAEVVAEDNHDHVKLTVHVTEEQDNPYYGLNTAAVICTTGAPTHALVVFPDYVLSDAIGGDYTGGNNYL